MSDTALRVRTATEIVDAAFKLYTRNLGQYILITGVAYSPSLIGSLVFRADQGDDIGTAIGTLMTLLITVVAMVLMTGTVTALGSRAYLDESVDVAAAARHAVRRIPALLISAILTGVLWIVGFLCFIVGFFYVASRFFATYPVIVLENKGVLGAFGRSSRLTDGRMWHVFGTLLLVYAIYLFGSLAVSALAIATSSFVVLTLVSTLYTIVAFPIVALATMVLYYDLRIRAEGFDLERMAQGLDPAAPVAASVPPSPDVVVS
jgi:hypothetical protein